MKKVCLKTLGNFGLNRTEITSLVFKLNPVNYRIFNSYKVLPLYSTEFKENEYQKYLNENYVKTGPALPPRGSTDPNNIGAFASYPHLNTACPMTSKSRISKKLEQRWPDAIGIGFPKCGTSATSFIDCHSKFVYRDGEG